MSRDGEYRTYDMREYCDLQYLPKICNKHKVTHVNSCYRAVGLTQTIASNDTYNHVRLITHDIK